MNQMVIFSERVITTLKSLPSCEREAVSHALANEFLLGQAPGAGDLTPMQEILYVMIRSYVERDMR